MVNKKLKYSFSVLIILFIVCPGFSQVRKRINLDKGWKFHFGSKSDPEKDFNYPISRLFAKTAENVGTCIVPTFDDSKWESVDLPHDWVVSLPFVYSGNADVKAHGYKPVGGLYPQTSIGWYRKEFELDASSDTTERVALTFDGVFRNCQVWVNDFYCGSHFSGYTGFSYDISDFVRYGRKNVIVVRVDASQYEGWFYEGAGIYRHVWLNRFGNLHFAENGIFVRSTLDKNFSNAELHIQTGIKNSCEGSRTVNVSTEIFDPEGRFICKTKDDSLILMPDEKKEIKERISIHHPLLWDLGSPKRYRAVSIIKNGNRIVDKVETRFGLREIDIDKEKGLFINGRNIKIKGVCCHQDHAGLGTALPDYMQFYRIGLLKEMGANAYRTSHNPPTPELLEACDSLGMLVLDETRLLDSGNEYMSQLRFLVERDRNHPSVFMWSIGNEEEVYQTKTEGKKIASSMLRAIRFLDPSRPITYAENTGNVESGVSEVIPVRGFNYHIDDIEAYHRAHPLQPVIGTEVGSTVSTRGVYVRDTVNCYVTDFDENYPQWASTAEKWWTLTAKFPWFIGGFVWTGFDYRGEPTPFGWPNINSHFGIMDVCGFPKNIYYYYQSWWTDKDVLHIAPHWNWKGREGQKIKVWVDSNAQTVELLLNGESLGKKKMPLNGHLDWNVSYRKGVLKARAYKNGKKLESEIETTDEPYGILLEPSKRTIVANGQDAVVINVSVKDKKGRVVPDANQLVKFSLLGDAKIIGIGNGDPSCHQPDKYKEDVWCRNLFNGKCQIIVLSGERNSNIRISAFSDGLKSSTTMLNQK